MSIVQVQVDETYQDMTNEVIRIIIDDVEMTFPKPVSFTDALRGLHQSIWQGVNSDEWLRLERASWEMTN